MNRRISMDKLNQTNATSQITGPTNEQTNAPAPSAPSFYGDKIHSLTKIFEGLDLSNGMYNLFARDVVSIDDDRYLAPDGKYVRARSIPSVWKGKSPYPPVFSDRLQCSHCKSTIVGLAAITRHLVQSHPHEDVYSFKHADVENSADERPTGGHCNLLASFGEKLIQTHIDLAQRIMTIAGLGAIIVHTDSDMDENDYEISDDTVDRFRVKKLIPRDYAAAPGGLLFASQTLAGTKNRDLIPLLPSHLLFATVHGLLYMAATYEDLANVRSKDWLPITFQKPAPTSKKVHPQTGEEGQGGLIMSGLGAAGPAEPATEAAANAATTTSAQSQAMGMNIGSEVAGTVGGTTVASSSAIVLRGPGVPPELGLMTGTQWNVVDQALGAYGIVMDGEISNTNYPQGTKVFELPLHTYTASTKAYIDQHVYMSGSTEFQVALYGTTNTTGAIIVYDEEFDNAAVTIARALARPHAILNASAGKTEVCMILHDKLQTAEVRQTGTYPTSPAIRAIMYSPLVNTFGTDLSLNLKVLSRPGPDFRVWSPRSYTASNKITNWTLPAVPLLEIDSNREIALLPKPDPTTCIETPGLSMFEALGTVGVPNRTNLQNVEQWNDVSILTRDSDFEQGYLTPFVASAQNDAGEKTVSLLAGAVDAEAITTNFLCRNRTAYLAEYTSGAYPDVLTVNIPSGVGYTGVPGQAVPNVSNGLVNRFSAGGSYITVKSWSKLGGHPGTVDSSVDVDSITSDRDVAVGPGAQPPALNPGYKALFPAFYPAPSIPAGVDAAFGALDGAADRWATSLAQLCSLNETDSFDADLVVDGKTLGKVRYLDKSLRVRSAVAYLEYPVGGSIELQNITSISSLDLPSFNFETWDKRQSTTRQVDFQHLEKVRSALTRLRKLPRVPITAYQRAIGGIKRYNISVQSAIAGIAGGALGGLGGGLGQWAQNDWWSKQFGANREHETQMAREQQLHDKQMMVAQLNSNYLANWSEQQMRMKNQGLTTPVPRVQTRNPFRRLINRAPENSERALVPAGNPQRAQVMNATARAVHSTAGPTLAIAGVTTGSSSSDPKSWRSRAMAKGPAPPPPAYGKPPSAPSAPLGEMTTHGMEQYHPASINDGARTTPSAVASAQAPFTEGQKRQ